MLTLTELTVLDGSAGARRPATHAGDNVELTRIDAALTLHEVLADVRAPVTAVMTAQRQHDAEHVTLVYVVWR